MDRGFRAVLERLGSDRRADPGALVKLVGTVLLSKVGGAAGPLYGTFFLRMAGPLTGKAEVAPEDLAAALRAGVEGVVARGKAEPGDKTMVDALVPALDALDAALADGACPRRRPAAAATAAEEGVRGHDPARGAQGAGVVPGRAQRRPPGPRRDVVAPDHQGRRRDARLSDGARTTGGGAMADYVGAIDQGTTSTRFMIFDHSGQPVGVDQREHEQIFPEAGLGRARPEEIIKRTNEVVGGGLGDAGIDSSDLAGVGITNQRETTVVWERDTGKPVYNAIVWQDTRTRPDLRPARGLGGAGPLPRRPAACPSPRTSRGRRSCGSSRTSRAPASAPRRARCCSATWTPGSSGTSPAGPTAAST